MLLLLMNIMIKLVKRNMHELGWAHQILSQTNQVHFLVKYCYLSLIFMFYQDESWTAININVIHNI